MDIFTKNLLNELHFYKSQNLRLRRALTRARLEFVAGLGIGAALAVAAVAVFVLPHCG